MRERIEDLGRLYTHLQELSNHELFELTAMRRPKDFYDYFCDLNEEDKEDLIRKIAYGLENVSFVIYDLILIASGQDDLNYSKETQENP